MINMVHCNNCKMMRNKPQESITNKRERDRSTLKLPREMRLAGTFIHETFGRHSIENCISGKTSLLLKEQLWSYYSRPGAGR